MDRSTTLGDAGLSVRGVNALNADGIVTVGDLADKVAREGESCLRRIPNFGSVSRDQALTILDRLKAKPEPLRPADMTLRDWFAGQAMPGIIAQPNLEGWEPHIFAKWAYQMADAMLAAREGSDNA